MPRRAVLASVLLALLCAVPVARTHTFSVISQVAPGDLLPPEEYRRMGVSAVWFYSGLPVAAGADGAVAWRNETSRANVEKVLRHFEGSGIAVIPLTNLFWEKHGEHGQVNRWGGDPLFRCFSADTADLDARLLFFVRECSRFSSLGGICIDDEPGVQPGGCVCPRCREAFRSRYAAAPPADGEYLKARPGIVPDDHPVLLWTRFQNDRMAAFYRTLAERLRKEFPALPVWNIPAAPYYGGKQLSAPGCPPATLTGSRRVMLDPVHIRNFQLYIQFYFVSILPPSDRPLAAGLCLAQMPRGLPIFSTVPIYDTVTVDNGKRASISVPAVRRFILQTFAEGSPGIVYFTSSVIQDPKMKEAATAVYGETIRPVSAATGDLRRAEGKVAVLFSASTAAFREIWTENPLERYRHLHRCDALCWYLLKKGLPFSVVTEDELDRPGRLDRFDTVISSGVDFLAKKHAAALSTFARRGGRLLLDAGSAVRLAGAKLVPFDAGAWYAAVETGCQRPEDLEYQAGLLETALGPHLGKAVPPCTSSSRRVNLNYLADGDRRYLFAVCDALDRPIAADLRFDREYALTDLATGKTTAPCRSVRVEMEPGSMRAFRLDGPPAF